MRLQVLATWTLVMQTNPRSAMEEIQIGIRVIAKSNKSKILICCPEAGISVNLGHPQGRALKWTLNFLGRLPCLSLIGIDL
jgi:hypothetical protein